MPGKLIAIEGIDGAGKGTQAKRLAESLTASGAKAALLSFPRYAETTFGGIIGDYLNGKFGPLAGIDPLFAALLFAGDRLESRPLLVDAIARNDYVICDRYVGSNMAYQGARASGGERQTLLDRIAAVEHTVNALPRADSTIFLNVSVATSKRLIAAKGARVYTDAAEDLHESDKSLLAAVREVYLTLAKQHSWSVIDCERGGVVRGVDEIAEDIARRVTQN